MRGARRGRGGVCGGRAGRTGAGALGFWPLHEKYSSMEHASCPSGTHRRPLPRPRPRRPGPGRGFNAPTCVSPTLRTLRREGGGVLPLVFISFLAACALSVASLFLPHPPFLYLSLSFCLLRGGSGVCMRTLLGKDADFHRCSVLLVPGA